MAAAATNEIEFVKEGPVGGSSSNEQVTTTGPSDLEGQVGTTAGTGIKGEKFQKVVMKPETGRRSGQCKVYNSKLFTNQKGQKIDDNAKIEDQVLTSAGITTSRGNTKYKTITVFYALTGDGGKNHKALLVEFDHGISGTKTYIKRNDAEGTTWVTYSISAVDESVLTSIAKEAGVIGGLGAGEQAAIGLSVTGLSGAGVGFAIYKNFTAVTGLIGKLF